MPKYKKCPRCELNYILEEEEYCEICREELRGIAHEEVLEDVEESGVCPICHVNFLNEGETVCESCAAEMEDNDGKMSAIGDVEPDWDIGDEEAVDETDLADDDVDLSVEDLAEEEAMDDEDDGYGDGNDEDDDLDDYADIDFDDED